MFLIRILFVQLLLVLSFSAFSQTAEQLRQFAAMPPQQQTLVAQQLGIDVNVLRRQATQQTQVQEIIETPTYPRGTLFDEEGNPVDFIENGLEDEISEDPPLELYGKSLFANGPSTFSPQLNGDVPNDYMIGTGDELRVQFFGQENVEFVLPVGVDGTISLPDIGPITVVGKSYAQAQNLVKSKVEQSRIGVNVVVSLTKLKTIRVFISGEAHKPGAYSLSAISTVTNALYAAGGVTDIASLRNIHVNRQGKTAVVMDVYDLLINGDANGDIPLRHGDVIHIPIAKHLVTVDGEVYRPAIYELKDNKQIKDLLELAGGTKPKGFTRFTGIQRVSGGVVTQLTVDADNDHFIVEDGDEINVPLVSERISNAISLIGAVVRPGQYQWMSGMTVRSLIGNPNLSLRDDADTSYILVIRQSSIASSLSFLQVDYSSSEDIDLQPNDKVMVFSTIEALAFNQEELQDLIATESQINDRRELDLSSFIEERKNLQRLGVYDQPDTVLDEEPAFVSDVELTENEKKSIKDLRASHPFSRKNLLSSIIKRIREDSGFMVPPKLIEVGGAVRVPGFYPLSNGATVQDAVKAAGGLLSRAHASRSEITRVLFGPNGEPQITHVDFSPLNEMSDATDKTQLVSRDRINIFTVPEWQEDIRVTLRGEVVFPGEYTVRRGETLAELLERAGGFTQYADQDALVFTRESLRVQERENLRKLSEELRKEIASESLRNDNSAGSIVSYQEARLLLKDLTKAVAVGRLVIDSNGGTNDKALDVLLEDQDFVVVPKQRQSVNVIGEVYVPTSHLFSDDISFDDYVQRSGGYRPLADSESAYIIRANGSVVIPGNSEGFWFSSGSNQVVIKPGDTIVVPYDSDNVETMTLWTNATQILYQLAVAVAAIGSL